MKRCPKCGETKQTTEFNKHASKRDGLACWCRVCSNTSSASWRAANPDKAKEIDAKYRAENIEKVKAKDARYKAANREKLAAYRLANREKRTEYNAAWRIANPEASRTHVQNRRARNVGKLSADLAIRLFKLQRGKCACGCKQPLGSNYHLDHIMPLALGGTNTDDNIQLLRARCNNQKHSKHPVDFMQQRGYLL